MMKHASPLSPPSSRQERAVEVVTLLGDSVVDVAHIEPPRTTRPRRVGYAFFVASALLLAVAAFAFAKGVHTAAVNQDALMTWTQSGQLAHDFRPLMLSPVYDLMAFGGLGLGLVSLVLGVVAIRTREPRTEFTLGTTSDADVSSAHAPSERFALVSHHGGQARVAIAPSMNAEMRARGASHDGRELVGLGIAQRTLDGGIEMPLAEGAKLSVDLGPLRFSMRQVALETGRLRALAAYFDERMAKFFGMSAIAHLAVLALFYTMPPDAHSLALDLNESSERLVRIHNPASEPPRVEPDADVQTGQDTDGPGSASMSIAEPNDQPGGSPGGEPANGEPSSTPRSREQAMTDARNSMLLVSLRENTAFAQLTDGSPLLPADMDGQLYAMIDQDGFGPGGSTFGNYVNGPGNQPGTIRVGTYNTIGWPGVPGSLGPGLGPGPDTITTRDRVAKKPVIKIDRPNIIGDLDKSIIRRYIKRKVERIQHCYERELMSEPSLAGTVTTEFMINGQGKVIFSKATGMGHPRLESCVADVVASVVFPRPNDSGSVQVKYPFHFRKAG